MQYFITDIHGDDHGLALLLEYAGVDFTKDSLVIGGDMIDRGKESGRVLYRIKALTEAYAGQVVALLGNHEEMALNFYRRGDRQWLRFGGLEAQQDIERVFPERDRRELLEWLGNLPLVYEAEAFVFTHAGLQLHQPLYCQERSIVWMDEAEFYSIPRASLLRHTGGRPVIHGHTPVERIYYDGARLNADLGSNTYAIQEERGLALVELEQMVYYAYKPFTGKIEKRPIPRI